MAALPGGELCARLRRGSDSFFGLGSLLAELHGVSRTARGSVLDIQSGGEAYDSRSKSSILLS